MKPSPDFYSQNFEDVILARCFSEQTEGFYIDVGAQYEEAESVTRHFYEAGWSGINIEPVKEFAETFQCRSRDTTICCAAGAEEEVRSMSVSLQSGLSSFDPINVDRTNRLGFQQELRSIRIRRLNDVLSELGYQSLDFDFLKIDVEGFELEVIKGIDLFRYRPRVILCEVTEPNTTIKNSLYLDLSNMIEGYQYTPVYFDGLNQWWCTNNEASALAKHFSLPPSVFDSTDITPSNGATTRRFLRETQAKLENVEAQLNKLEAQLNKLSQELSKCHHAVAKSQDDLSQTAALLTDVEQELASMKASRIWRATKPLRISGIALRKAYDRARHGFRPSSMPD
jgi:FkbM family methyltransferase